MTHQTFRVPKGKKRENYFLNAEILIRDSRTKLTWSNPDLGEKNPWNQGLGRSPERVPLVLIRVYLETKLPSKYDFLVGTTI